MKIHHGAIVVNVVIYVYAKLGDDRLWNEIKALADLKSDNNNTNKKNNSKNNVDGYWGLVPGSKNSDSGLKSGKAQQETWKQPNQAVNGLQHGSRDLGAYMMQFSQTVTWNRQYGSLLSER